MRRGVTLCIFAQSAGERNRKRDEKGNDTMMGVERIEVVQICF